MHVFVFILLAALLFQSPMVSGSRVARRRRRREAAQREDALRKVYCATTAVVLGISPNTCPETPVWGSHIDSKHLEQYKSICDPSCTPALNIYENKRKSATFAILASFGAALVSTIIFTMCG